MLFDFDKTIIECDSDDWVIQNLGFTELFNTLLPTMPYNSLMDRIMGELHSQGTTIQDIAEWLINVPLSPNITHAIKSAYASGCDLRIVSNANTFFIETILKHNGVLHCFSEINTNPVSIEEDGRLKILPYHDFNSSSHGCNLCPPNLCKGLVLRRIQASSVKKRFVYVGDGKNDYCPSLKLTTIDYVMPRKHLPLWDAICSDPTLISASIHEWEDANELGRMLINLITTLMMKPNHDLAFEDYVSGDCKSSYDSAHGSS